MWIDAQSIAVGTVRAMNLRVLQLDGELVARMLTDRREALTRRRAKSSIDSRHCWPNSFQDGPAATSPPDTPKNVCISPTARHRQEDRSPAWEKTEIDTPSATVHGGRSANSTGVSPTRRTMEAAVLVTACAELAPHATRPPVPNGRSGGSRALTPRERSETRGSSADERKAAAASRHAVRGVRHTRACATTGGSGSCAVDRVATSVALPAA